MYTDEIMLQRSEATATRWGMAMVRGREGLGVREDFSQEVTLELGPA